MDDRKIILRAKDLIKLQGKVALLWLIDEEFNLVKDINHAENIASKMTKGIRYERFEGHNKEDIFIRQRADFYPKLIGLIALIIGTLIAIFKVLSSLWK